MTQEELQKFVADLPARAAVFAFQLSLTLVEIAVILALTFGLEKLLERFLKNRLRDSAALSLALRRTVRFCGFALAAFVALATMGVNPTALFTALGLTSVALGFAFKDTIEQALTGMFLLYLRPFKVGDTIEVQGIEGVVHDVAVRTTNLRTFDGVEVLVPNNAVYQSVIRNKSYYVARRWQLTLGLAHDTDLRHAHDTFIRAAKSVSGVLDSPAPVVAFDSFEPTGIRTVVRYWLEPRVTDPVTTQNAVLQALIDAARREGFVLPVTLTAATPPPSAEAIAAARTP